MFLVYDANGVLLGFKDVFSRNQNTEKNLNVSLFILPNLFNFQNIEMVHWYDFIHLHIDSCSCTIRFNGNLKKSF